MLSTSLQLSAQSSDPPLGYECNGILGDSPEMPLVLTNCPFSSILPEDLSALPVATIHVNFHFIRFKGDLKLGPGNFKPDLSWGEKLCGDKIAQLLVDGCNNDAMNVAANPLNLAVGYPNYIGDSKLRLRIVGNGNGNGIYYWDEKPSSFPNNNVVNIIIDSDTKYNVNGYTNFNSKNIYLNNMYKLIFTDSANWWDYKNLLWHELGHAFGILCHSFETQGNCANEDINTPAECGTGPGNNDCGSPDKPGCSNWSTQSNNIMGYNGKVPWALSPCQWTAFYSGIYTTSHKSTIDFCSDNSQPPIIIPSGAFITWSTLKLLNRDVIVQTGAQLTINCEVRMGADRTIKVERGAKLIVDDGAIRNLCFEKRWGGIYVEGNNTLPQPDPNSFPGLNEAGIVFVKNGSVIEGAADAMITARPGELWNEQYWGGVMYAENSSFVNNRRVAAFMRYTFPNKSKFRHCSMNESGSLFNSYGVTVWNCKGITFEGNDLGPFDNHAIYGIDMGIEVLADNTIHNCQNGIESLVTTPLVGNIINVDGSSTPNKFMNNKKYDILLHGSDLSLINRVKSNYFLSGSSSSVTGVAVDGYATVDIKDNSFANRDFSILLSNAELLCQLHCNIFESNTSNGIVLTGNNEKTLFYNNTFNAGHLNISVLPQASQPGKVFSPQNSSGSDDPTTGLAADNCFYVGNKQDIYANPTNTVLFNYKRRVPDGSCYVPNNHLSDGGANNYMVEDAGPSVPDCDDNSFDLPPTTEEYASWRTYTQYLKSMAEAMPSNSALVDSYHLAELKLSHWRTLLVSQALATHEYTAVEGILDPETNIIAQKMKFGLALAGHDYTKAQSILDQLPEASLEDQYFKYTQQICLQINQLPWSDTLTIAQLTQLHLIAQSELPSKVYARGILALKTGARFEPLTVLMPVLPETREAAQSESSVDDNSWSVSPNPAENVLNIQMEENKLGALLHVVDVFGKTWINTELCEGTTRAQIEISKIPSGLYIAVLQKRGQTERIRKFVKK